MAQGNLHSVSEQRVFYVYGIPEDQQSSATVKNFFTQNGIKEVNVDGKKVRVVVSGKESVKSMREKFPCFEGHDLIIMPELCKEFRILIDEEWTAVKDLSCPKNDTILQGMDVKVSKTPEGVFLSGSVEGINVASQIIREMVGAEILKNKLSTAPRKTNGHGYHNSESGIHSENELATESSVNDSEMATGSLANSRPNGATVEKGKPFKGAAGCNGENESDKSDSNDLAVATASVEANIGQSNGLFKGPQIEPTTHSRNLATSTTTNGMAEMTAADKKVAEKDSGISSGHINGNMADADTINLQDHQLQFVKRFHPDLYEPLVKLPTVETNVRSKSFAYLSNEFKKNKIDRLIKVTENPKSVIGEFLRRTNVLERLTAKYGDKLKLLVNDPSQGNTVEIIGLPEDIKLLQSEIDKWREVLLRKASHECVPLNGFQVTFITNCYPEVFEDINRNFFIRKESDNVTLIFGTSDEVIELRNWIKTHGIDHLRRVEQRMPTGFDENTCKVILRSLPSEVKIYLEFLSTGKILIVGLMDDIEKFRSVLKTKSHETMNAPLKNLEQTSSPSGPVGRTEMTAADHKSNESRESTSSDTDGRRMTALEIFHLNDIQWQFTQRFHSDLHEQLTDYVEQNHEMKKKHYTQLLDMIKNKNIDRVEKVNENANNVETSVLQRLAAKLPRSLKVLVSFPSDGPVVEIIGLPEDAERWWILLQKEIDAYKSDLLKKLPQASHAIQTHEVKFIQTFYSEVYDYIKSLHVQKKSEKEILYAGTFDELDKLKRWLRRHDIDRLEIEIEKMPTFVDEADCKEVHGSMKEQIKLCLSFPSRKMYEAIGFKVDIRRFQDELKQREEVNKKKLVEKSVTASLSRTESDSSHLYGATSSSDKEFAFQTPLSSIQVKIAQGNLTKQKTEAIVNPCNGYLMHMGGAAKAIADAAGRDLTDDCNKYIAKNRSLRISEVMHSRSGRLNPPIKHVIHACGPNAKEYLDKRKCQDALENTFFNCFEYANNDLHVDSMSVPAISSGTFGVPKDIVAQSTWKALMRFDEQMSKTSKTKCLKFICFVNIDQESTNSLVQTFKKHWNAYLFEQKSKVDTVKSEGASKSSSKLRRSNSLPRRRSLKDQDSAGGVIDRDGTSMAKIKQNHDSEESKSVRGTTPQGVRPQIKTTGSVVPNNVTESKCCVCVKPRKISYLFTRSNCPHKCCASCMSGKCQRCIRSMKTESGPPSTRALMQSPTGEKKESDVERRPESPEAMSNGNEKAPRSRGRRRSASVGYFGDAAVDIGDVDLKDDRSENRAKSAAASSTSDNQQLQQDDNCCICMDKIDNPKKLDCGHIFCKDCIDEAFTHQTKCPSCGRIFGLLKGNQPDGKMAIGKERLTDLRGYPGCGAIVITYNIPDGIQTADHPNPGQRFHGTSRTAYLPGNAEGEEVCHLLQRAFDAKLIFTIGKSNTTGRDNVVVWNDIHHKTSTVGQYGYPDSTYLQRVKDELAAKGIKSDTARASPSVDINSTDRSGSATGGYSHSPYSSWGDNNKGFASLPITGAYASPHVHSRDFGAPSSLLTNIGVGSSSYPFSDVAGVHTASIRSSRAVSPVNSSSSLLLRSHLPLNSSNEWSTTRYNEPLRTSLPQYTSTTSSTYTSSSAGGTSGYNLRPSSSTSSSANAHQPSSYYRKYRR